ncbi:hypothetical protein MD484_g2638, partial [Candolleomyces efflorescens]
MNIKRPTAIQRASLPLMLPTQTHSEARDVFLQSQTGSGKTLSYLLPIIQDLLPLSSQSYIDRSIGTLAIIIAPTRELAKQISDVLEALLKMRLRAEDDATGEAENSTRMTRWLVSGLLIGGSTRTHEKAKLRKGIPILVSTPGRLLDHIQNTASFNVGKCQWLVLDEADQLMELGFEETITGILKGLEGRRRLAMKAVEEGKSAEVGGWDWDKPRRTVLCSATIRESVQKLAGTALVNPLMIKATEGDKDDHVAIPDLLSSKSNLEGNQTSSTSLTPPSQLSQKYVVVPLKLRLVTLLALLRTLIAQSNTSGTKIIVFLSCTDSVDFHWNLLGGAHMGSDGNAPESDEDEDEDSDEDEDDTSDAGNKSKRRPQKKLNEDAVEAKCALLPDVTVYRLHGSLPTATRMRALKGFAGPRDGKKASAATQSSSSILLCTSVAARGLDLPLVKAVVQYDLPTEGGPTEYIHRIGRTARAGKGGEAWSIVAPSESEWATWVVDKMQGDDDAGNDSSKKVSLASVPLDTVLQNGFGGRGKEFEARATEVQLAFERWVLRNSNNAALARGAYLSHMRAYATHPSNEKHMFHIRHLHLGHLAKSFALREAPTKVNASMNAKAKGSSSSTHKSKTKRDNKSSSKGLAKPSGKSKVTYDSDSEYDQEAEKRMKAVVRAQGRLSKKGGTMMRTDTSEFQVMDTNYLEKLVQGHS